MAKNQLHERALEMREQGMSYSQIREKLGVSKSTLSLWLHNFPLSEERIRLLRDFSDQRIEHCRETKARKRAERKQKVYERVSLDIGVLSDREVLLCGLFLYWGEGGKTVTTAVSISNTDPGVLLFFIKWLSLMGVPKERLSVRLQLYTDMNTQEELLYWSSVLGLPPQSFRKPYVKKSNRSGLTYKQKFSHGTCNITYGNRDISEYILAGIERLQIL